MLNDCINKKYLSKTSIKKIKSNFRKAKPYPHFVIPDFFNKNKISKLKKTVLKERFEKIGKDLFSLSHTKDMVSSKNSVIKEFHNLFSSKDFISYMEKLTGEKLSQKIDMQAHSMAKGDYLLFHDDLVEGRKIAYVVYLTSLRNSDGGALGLYDIKKPLKPIKKIIPKSNSFMCFKVSSKSLHAVEEIKGSKQRLTLGGWFYGS